MKVENLQVLIADEGKWLTKDGAYSKKVYLGTLDKAENWTEVSEEEYQEEMKKREESTASTSEE